MCIRSAQSSVHCPVAEVLIAVQITEARILQSFFAYYSLYIYTVLSILLFQ